MQEYLWKEQLYSSFYLSIPSSIFLSLYPSIYLYIINTYIYLTTFPRLSLIRSVSLLWSSIYIHSSILLSNNPFICINIYIYLYYLCKVVFDKSCFTAQLLVIPRSTSIEEVIHWKSWKNYRGEGSIETHLFTKRAKWQKWENISGKEGGRIFQVQWRNKNKNTTEIKIKALWIYFKKFFNF